MTYSKTLSGIKSIPHFIKWNEWDSCKISIYCTLLAYIALSNTNVYDASMTDIILYFLFVCANFILAHVTNNWGDMEMDRLHGKSNPFEQVSYKNSIIILAAFFIIAIISGIPFTRRPYFIEFWIGWIFFMFAYPLYPLRLKERGIIGLTTSSFAQWTLPMLITFTALKRLHGLDVIIFLLAHIIIRGTREIGRYRNEQQQLFSTGTKAFGFTLSLDKVDQLYTIALFLDKMAIGVILISIFGGISPFCGFWFGLIPLLIYLILLAMTYFETTKALIDDIFLDPYYSGAYSANKILHVTLPNFIIPGYLLLLMIQLRPINAVLLILFLFWCLVFGNANWRTIIIVAQNWRHSFLK